MKETGSLQFMGQAQDSVDQSDDVSSKERVILLSFLVIVGLLTGFDLFEDRMEGAEWLHLAYEGFIVLFCTLGAIYLWLRALKTYRRQHRELNRQIIAARKDVQHWRGEAATLLRGLGEAIDKQFNAWKLTDAEKEVALMMLKGLSHKEIAQIRSTSEKTVRQQAAFVYRKAEIEGRAQLSAFFLEDLLLPLSRDEGRSAAQ